MTETAAPEPWWWLLDFYNDERRLFARFRVEAGLPTTAKVIAHRELLAAYPATPRRATLFDRARRTDSDDSGWALYRIASEP
jgi:hypothetical protein